MHLGRPGAPAAGTPARQRALSCRLMRRGECWQGHLKHVLLRQGCKSQARVLRQRDA